MMRFVLPAVVALATAVGAAQAQPLHVQSVPSHGAPFTMQVPSDCHLDGEGWYQCGGGAGDQASAGQNGMLVAPGWDMNADFPQAQLTPDQSFFMVGPTIPSGTWTCLSDENGDMDPTSCVKH